MLEEACGEDIRRDTGQITRWRTAKVVLTEAEAFLFLEWRRVRRNRMYRIRKWERRLLGKNFRFVQRILPAACAEHA